MTVVQSVSKTVLFAASTKRAPRAQYGGFEDSQGLSEKVRRSVGISKTKFNAMTCAGFLEHMNSYPSFPPFQVLLPMVVMQHASERYPQIVSLPVPKVLDNLYAIATDLNVGHSKPVYSQQTSLFNS